MIQNRVTAKAPSARHTVRLAFWVVFLRVPLEGQRPVNLQQMSPQLIYLQIAVGIVGNPYIQHTFASHFSIKHSASSQRLNQQIRLDNKMVFPWDRDSCRLQPGSSYSLLMSAKLHRFCVLSE